MSKKSRNKNQQPDHLPGWTPGGKIAFYLFLASGSAFFGGVVALFGLKFLEVALMVSPLDWGWVGWFVAVQLSLAFFISALMGVLAEAVRRNLMAS